jgi:hypothetical protein
MRFVVGRSHFNDIYPSLIGPVNISHYTNLKKYQIEKSSTKIKGRLTDFTILLNLNLPVI